MEQLILKLANISHQINNPLPIYNLYKLNVDRLKCIRIIRRVFLLNLRENTDYITTIPSNANLFFHSWLFTFEPRNQKFAKIRSPFIGIFHPYGSIHAHNNSKYLNNLIRTRQNYHSPEHFSPNNSQIYIDHTNIGKAIIACVDYQIPEPKGRIELLISLTTDMANDYEVLNRAESDLDINDISCIDFIKKISIINKLEILYSNDLKSLFSNENINLVNKPIYAGRADNRSESLVVCFYNRGRITTQLYTILLNINFPILKKNIPYFNEINANLLAQKPQLRDINWEFGIQIITPYVNLT